MKIIFRNFRKLKYSSVINLIGLSLGFTVLFAVIFFVWEELNYNKFHENLEDIYCVFTHDDRQTNKIGWNQSVPALSAVLREEFPEVVDAGLINNGEETLLLSNQNNKFYEKVQLAEPNIFNIFSFPIKLGSIPKEMENNRILALSERMASKYFGDQNPIGKTLRVNNKDYFTVIAVFKNIPTNSSIQFDIWAPISLMEEGQEGYLDTWYNLSFQNYVLLDKNADASGINKKLINRVQQSNPDSHERAQLFPFENLYLESWGRMKSVNMMILVGIIILAIITLNFVNLQSAETFKRIKDFGIRKINGARPSFIYKLLISETIIHVVIALLIGLAMTYVFSDYLLEIVGKQDMHKPIIFFQSVGIVSALALIIALLSGWIPGITIVSASLQNSLKDKVGEKVSILRMRSVFTSLQFAMTIGLIVCLLIINKQVNYLKNKNLGFNKEQLAYIDLRGELTDKYDLLKEEITHNPNIESASITSRSPIGIYWNGGGWDWEGKPDDFDPQITFIETDDDFQETFKMEMAEGGFFNTDIPGVVINKTFANMIAPNESVINKMLSYDEMGVSVPIIGVISDFHFKPLNQKIGALMIMPQLGYDDMKYLFLRISPNDMKGSLDFIESTVNKINPDFPYKINFLDEDFDRLYKGEENLRNQLVFFSVIAMFISCMGLWGILIFALKRRTKEIGVRKVNGARVWEIIRMINMDIFKWVVLAFLVATPLAWYAMNKWLENFAYKTELSWWIFALAGMIALGIALLTVSWQSWKAATRNPVEALRYE